MTDDGVRVRDVAEPTPAAGEVLLRVQTVGVNQLDLNVIAGSGPGAAARLPRILGIDPAGIVAAVGPGIDADLIGSEVVAKPNIPCGHCRWCGEHRESECPAQEVLGVHRDGGACESVAVPLSVVFPRHGLPAATATAAVHSVPIVLNAFDAADVRVGERVLVTGAGGVLGRVALDVGRHLGASVTAASRHPVPGLPPGVREIVTGAEANLAGAVAPSDRFDVVIDTSGSAALLTQAVALLDWCGRAVFCAASVDAGLHLDARSFYLRRHRLIGVASATFDQVTRGLELVRQGVVQVPIAHRFPLTDVDAAYAAFAAPRHGKVIIDV
ncbi:alcohol dehydrogenase catalytic domain-containing protein [Ruania alkalisoli]|uniref:Alcohol dehydrogenase catalytic domain-containing protein n=1 Tax=Ruania alkalisoli TaxID=2779775 RepID=A0A7M1ST06_9MICO|nr:alcohol dehydrogenase catalytic domain-containing protein [Ruania alkalisoli]QOR70696.1 alcohol dehydrogenase catalytic domain-containing protein [Ruania alkalisoli]